MSSSSGNRTVKLWTCCNCKDTGISMTLGDCPQCRHSRCFDCDVKSHIASDAEIEEENGKVQRSTAMGERLTPTFNQPGSSFQQQPRAPECREQLSTVEDLGQLERYRPIPICPLSSGAQDAPIFVLRAELDADLISAWSYALPNLSNRLLGVNLLSIQDRQGFEGARVTSLHLVRVGFAEQSSLPTVIVNTSLPLHYTAQHRLQGVISLAFRHFTSLEDDDDVIQILFRTSKVRRSVGSPVRSLPPICEPRNRRCSSTPGTGASIGIYGSYEDTATLGCYVLVDGSVMVLTVDHLVPMSSKDATLTHISEQDCYEMMIPAIQILLNDWTASTHSCDSCAAMRRMGMSASEIWEASKFILGTANLIGSDGCPFAQALKAEFKSRELFQALLLGNIFRKSDTRYRCNLRGVFTEMDWALFAFDHHVSAPIEHCYEDVLGTTQELHIHDSIKPGASVRSLGRTSGHQRGMINTAISVVYHDEYVTQEWCVINRPENSADEWITGGIGVDGDSGALIVDEEDNGIYGMLWGRTGDGPATMTIFTPIREIFHDIEERTGHSIELLRGQCMARPGSIEVVPEGGPTVPITLSIGEEQASSSHEATYSESRQQSSADTRHPHAFERYRGRDRPNPIIPRTMVQDQSPEANSEGSQWPGVHTYVRYAVAPEQE